MVRLTRNWLCNLDWRALEVNGRVVRLLDLTESEIEAWWQLSQSAAEPSPMFEPATLLPAAHLLPNGARIYLVVAEEDGRFFGCFPIDWSRRGKDRMSPTSIELLLRTVTTMVRRNRYDLTPLLRPERISESMETLLTVVANCPAFAKPRLLRFECLSADGPVEESLRAAAGSLGIRLYDVVSWTRPIVRRRADGQYKLGAQGNRRNDKRILRYRRRLGEALGGEVHLVDRSNDPAAIAELLRLERSGYKFATGVALESWEGEAQWFQTVCDEFRRRNRLVVCTLEAADTAVAILIMLRGGDRLLAIHKAYDESFKQFNPGLQLDLEFFDYFHSVTDAEMIDSCTGALNEKSARLYPESRRAVTVIAAIGGHQFGLLLAIFGVLRNQLRNSRKLLKATTASIQSIRSVHWLETRIFRRTTTPGSAPTLIDS